MLIYSLATIEWRNGGTYIIRQYRHKQCMHKYLEYSEYEETYRSIKYDNIINLKM